MYHLEPCGAEINFLFRTVSTKVSGGKKEPQAGSTKMCITGQGICCNARKSEPHTL